MTLMLFIVVLASVSLNAAAQVLLRKAMLAAMPLPPLNAPVTLAMHMAGNLYLWLGLTCFAGSILLWLGVLSRIPVSAAYPLASLGYIIAAASGVVFLGEAVSVMRAVGLVLICIGVFVVAQSA
jgi:multidrug transporter EmrE-like cation transporter